MAAANASLGDLRTWTHHVQYVPYSCPPWLSVILRHLSHDRSSCCYLYKQFSIKEAWSIFYVFSKDIWIFFAAFPNFRFLCVYPTIPRVIPDNMAQNCGWETLIVAVISATACREMWTEVSCQPSPGQCNNMHANIHTHHDNSSFYVKSRRWFKYQLRHWLRVVFLRNCVKIPE